MNKILHIENIQPSVDVKQKTGNLKKITNKKAYIGFDALIESNYLTNLAQCLVSSTAFIASNKFVHDLVGFPLILFVFQQCNAMILTIRDIPV